MFKLLLSLPILFTCFNSVSFASDSHLHATNQTIDTVYYDAQTHSYNFDTKPVNGSTWTDTLFNAANEDKSTTQVLNVILDCKSITITYNDNNSDNSEDWYAVDWCLK